MNNEQDDNQFNTGGYNIGNFDISSIQEEEVILMVLDMDVSPSVQPFERDLNDAFRSFIEEMQKSHVAPKIMIKAMEFNENVVEKSGFMPISQVDVRNFVFKAKGSSTALFASAHKAVESAIEYKLQLESQGINVKTLVFVITDGMDNASGNIRASSVATMLDDLAKKESNVFSFETVLFGIGTSHQDFENAQKAMHFKHLAVVGQSAAEIRKMIGFISASVSKSASNQPIAF